MRFTKEVFSVFLALAFNISITVCSGPLDIVNDAVSREESY